MFASAVRAKRRGQGSQAIRIFERFTREYPNSPLTESAVAQRMKLLALIDTVAARRAATDYLSRYPNGFARLDARHLIDAP
jgi:outer membrane protein assembly factor BamD (BamD/ComL family)